MRGGIFWLASYPKSGNTWFRIFLTNLKQKTQVPADINELDTDGIASSRALLDDILGFSTSDLLPDEIDRLRPAAYRWQHAHAVDEPCYIKVHDALHSASGQLLFESDATRGAVYILRNPLDVAISYADQWGVGIDKAIIAMSHSGHGLVPHQRSLRNQVRQHLSSWSEHVQGWTQQDRFPCCVLRYEDMLYDTEASFGRAARFLGIEHDAQSLRRAIAFSDFGVLAEQEAEKGFGEKLRSEQRFFRSGKACGWRDVLTDEQVGKIIADHGAVMHQYGYLDPEGLPVTGWSSTAAAPAFTCTT